MESPSSAIRATKPNPKSPSPAATTTSNHLVPVVGSTATLQRRPSSARERDESERNREEPAGLVSPSIGHGCRGRSRWNKASTNFTFSIAQFSTDRNLMFEALILPIEASIRPPPIGHQNRIRSKNPTVFQLIRHPPIPEKGMKTRNQAKRPRLSYGENGTISEAGDDPKANGNVCHFLSLQCTVIYNKIRRIYYYILFLEHPYLLFLLENSTPMEAKSELEDEMGYIINHQTLACVQNLLTNNIKRRIKKEACWTISNLTAGNMEQIQLSDKVMEYGVTALRILNQVLMLQVSPLIIFYQMRWKSDC
ncbi:hypothetical protein LXL04_029571 [Taraxacum kok-saghyz]